MADIIIINRKSSNKGAFVKSFRGKAKTVARILGNDAYFYICQNGIKAKPKQTRRFITMFGTDSR